MPAEVCKVQSEWGKVRKEGKSRGRECTDVRGER